MMRYVLLVAIGASLPGQTPQYKAPEERLPRAVAPQPLPFSHTAHVAAGSKCVDCHVSVERRARVDSQADRCMLCHQAIKKDSPQIRELARIRESGRGFLLGGHRLRHRDPGIAFGDYQRGAGHHHE